MKYRNRTPSIKVVNVESFAGGMRRWVHPTNLEFYGRGQYRPVTHLSPEGRPYNSIRFCV